MQPVFFLHGFHFRNYSLMQDDSADRLGIEMTHLEGANQASLTVAKASGRIASRGSPFDAFPIKVCLGFELGIGHALHPRLQVGNLVNQGHKLLEFSIVLTAEYFR